MNYKRSYTSGYGRRYMCRYRRNHIRSTSCLQSAECRVQSAELNPLWRSPNPTNPPFVYALVADSKQKVQTVCGEIRP